MSPFAHGPALLFCPADRPDRFRKAQERADAVILDLEDAVAPDRKDAARHALRAADVDPSRTIVRVNAFGTDDFTADLDALAGTGFRTVMLAKAESTDVLGVFDDGYSLIALCETARGVQRAEALAADPKVAALMWGAEDLVASIGGTSSRRADGGYRDVARQARSRVLLAAAAEGKAAIDAVYVDIPDLAGLSAEAADAAASGFAATACIHPSQVDAIRAAYRPDAQILAWACGVLAAATAHAGGVFRYEGRMVDEPLLRHARMLLARGGREG